MFMAAFELNRANILAATPPLQGGKMLDLGCDDGQWTKRVSERMQAREVVALEINEDRAQLARARGIDARIANLEAGLPFADEEFDFVHANQVIEHVMDIDVFASEIYRILKPGRFAVISTENASSWHNIGATALGWQMFSLTNLSATTLGIGNPLALHRGTKAEVKSMVHRVIFSTRGLREFLEAHGFEVLRMRGAGYYPLPAAFGKWDVRHAAYITATIRRPSAV